MLDQFKAEIRDNPFKFTIVFFILFILVVVCIYPFRGYFTNIWPNERSIANARKELLNAQKKLQVTLNENNKLLERRKSLLANRRDFWLIDRDGDATLNTQKKINKAAEDAGIILSSVGAARTEKATEGISLVSTSIRSKATLKKMSVFINEIEKIHPRAYWKSLVLRPDNPRNPVDIVMTGNIQFIVITHQKALTLLKEKK